MTIYKQNIEKLKHQPNLALQLDKVEPIGLFRKDSPIPPETMIFLLLGADYVKKWPTKAIHNIIVEPDLHQLKYFLSNYQLPENRDYLFIVTSNLDKISRIFYSYLRSELRLAAFESTVYLFMNNLQKEEAVFFQAVLQKYVLAGHQAITTFSGSPIHFSHGLRHYSYNCTKKHIDYRTMKDAYINIPALLISGGPSIEKDIEAIKEFKGIISSVDSPYGGLLEKGIKVDFVASMDREPRLLDYYESPIGSTTLVTIPEVSNKILEKFEPNIVMLPTLRKFYVTSLGFDDAYNAGTCTAHMLYTFLKYIGCSPIILIGQDLGVADQLMPFNIDGSERTSE